ncbi:hypothetical protein N2599_32510 (plasmid) [Rhizobium sullae]|uniref:Amidohydrolase n=1 Tax=Rhizobium sullae TaxID=50338 RepID=A0A2N0DFZ9_RHISU|nr:hypothetical protein [Rhizobium sullae]PKA45025.1 hypothetical protein CWR43_04235 [Rhizobium sullae]UWU17465.1 hypothetical protein N2599_32510 [Rhizobium sullae]
MKLIGIEEHFIVEEVPQAWTFAGLDDTDPSVAYHPDDIERRLLDIADERIAFIPAEPVARRWRKISSCDG